MDQKIMATYCLTTILLAKRKTGCLDMFVGWEANKKQKPLPQSIIPTLSDFLQTFLLDLSINRLQVQGYPGPVMEFFLLL